MAYPTIEYDTFMNRVPALFLLVAMSATAFAAKTLDLYFVDVEGGQATLIVSPSGQSLLVDTGYAGFGGRDAIRIAAAAKQAGVKRIDYLLITHFHDDHVGGVRNLLERMPVTNFLDHGPSIETGGYPEEYSTAIAKGQHKVVVPGDKIPIKDLDITVVAAAGKEIGGPGEPNSNCAGVEPRSGETGENTQSAAIIVQFGKFRFADLGDLTFNRELALMCPENKVGKIDLYLATHHGGESPKAIWGMSPRVAIMNNGPRKGDDPLGWKNLSASPGLEALWQLHYALEAGKESNAPDTFIANLDERCNGIPLRVSATADGAFTVTNPRNKVSRTYAAR
jgi:competence protein ComEC